MNSGDLVGPVVIHSADTVRYANHAFCALVDVDDPASVTALGGSVELSDNDPQGSVLTLQVPVVTGARSWTPPSEAEGP